MRVDEAETRLREMFAEAGLDSPDVDLRTAARTAWTTYKAFAAEPVDVAANDPDADMVLFEIGAADWEDGRRTFNLMLTRQFVLNDASGEYDHMEHLHCHLYCDLTPELERLGFDTGVFLPTATHLDEWISDVEKSAGFAMLMEAPSSRVLVAQENV